MRTHGPRGATVDGRVRRAGYAKTSTRRRNGRRAERGLNGGAGMEQTDVHGLHRQGPAGDGVRHATRTGGSGRTRASSGRARSALARSPSAGSGLRNACADASCDDEPDCAVGVVVVEPVRRARTSRRRQTPRPARPPRARGDGAGTGAASAASVARCRGRDKRRGPSISATIGAKHAPFRGGSSSAARWASLAAWPALAWAARQATDPGRLFRHGVASGDPLTDRVILWTRVTPRAERRPVSRHAGGSPTTSASSARWRRARWRRRRRATSR